MPAAKRTRAGDAPATEPERASKRTKATQEPEKAPAKAIAKPVAKKPTAVQSASKVTKAKAVAAPKTAAPKKSTTKKEPTTKKTAVKKAAPRARAVSKAPSVQAEEPVVLDKYAIVPLGPLKDLPVINSLKNTKPLDIFVFGEGGNSELGLGSLHKDKGVKRPRFNPKLAEKDVICLGVGGMHTVAITKDNKIISWGVNDAGALGRDTRWDGGTRDMDDDESDSDDSEIGEKESGLNPLEANPYEIPSEYFHDNVKFVDVCAGDSSSFALTDQGRVYGWGSFRSNEGLLGFSPTLQVAHKPVLLETLKNIIKIASGANHAMAIDNKGKMFLWGSGQQHQLGRRVTLKGDLHATIPSYLSIKDGRRVAKIKDINCGAYHNFAITEDDKVFAWGSNNFGQCGLYDGYDFDGSGVNVKVPTETTILPGNLRYLKAGGHHSFAITSEGKVLVWGRCDGKQMGIDLDTVPRDHLVFSGAVPMNPPPPVRLAKFLKVPTVVPGIDGAVITGDAGQDHSIVITENGKAYSWGFNVTHQCGLGNEDEIEVATRIENSAVKERKIIMAGAGEQFGMLAAYRKPLANGTS